jgi:single-strand DNA-binding protein
MNKTLVLGRIATDLELRQTNDGKSVTSFTMAVDRPGTYGDNKKTDWLDIVAWRSTAEFICKHFAKGDPILVEGVLTSRNWEDKAGQKRKNIEIVAENVEFLPRAKAEGKPEIANNAVSFAKGLEEDFTTIDDEDIPF